MVDAEPTSRDRGQLVIIGALALAFIVLGIVVVFNGILYTEGLPSGTTSQSATTAETTDAEIEQGVGCVLVRADNESDAAESIAAFGESYEEMRSQSTAAVVTVESGPERVSVSGSESANAMVTVAYDSHDVTHETNLSVDESHCPEVGDP
jgi:hypothetical protein